MMKKENHFQGKKTINEKRIYLVSLDELSVLIVPINPPFLLISINQPRKQCNSQEEIFRLIPECRVGEFSIIHKHTYMYVCMYMCHIYVYIIHIYICVNLSYFRIMLI